jgi:hypothetical protein
MPQILASPRQDRDSSGAGASSGLESRGAARVGPVKRVVIVLVGLAVAACSQAPTTPEPTRTPPPLELSVRPDGEWLVVKGHTTVPDGTKVTLLVGRNVKFRKDDVPRSTTIAKGDATVESGRFRARLPVDESQLVFDANGKRYGRIEVVSDSVTACAQVRAKTSAKPLEAIATTAFPSGVMKDLKVGLKHPPEHRPQVGRPFCAIE